ncbi:LytR/AlgR family response regulator transcription factor [Confluentibacter sediminis]|uniref:LytR/AlgR family response regulator transcription factor n=1 Tax=Confluentibacter sediminis TaxID=2219045 RepID=UPI000DAEEAC7|nr:LytTR family transcriptional regulator DNA-binding domain-containing protein [Confluentibacter sediminis]
MEKNKTQNDSKATLEHIAINTKENIKIVKASNILYLEASRNSTIVYLQNKTSFKAFKNLGYYEKLFKEIHFIKVHRSYLINVAHLENIFKDKGGYYCVLKENCIVPISNRKIPFIKKFLHF